MSLDWQDRARAVAAIVAYPDTTGGIYSTTPVTVRQRAARTKPQQDTAWMADAACRGAVNVMFPLDRPITGRQNRRTQIQRHIDEAVAICDRCTVIDRCAAWADIEKPYAGVHARQLWHAGAPKATTEIADMKPNHLYAMSPKRGPGRPRLTDAHHGTIGGYRWHQRNDGQPCPDCLAAHAAYNRESYAKRRLRIVKGDVA